MEWFGYIFYIFLVGLCLAAIIALIMFPEIYAWATRPEPDFIEVARDVTFEVIEASLTDKPEEWAAVRGKTDTQKVYWLTNGKAGISLYLGGGSPTLHVRTRSEDNQKVVPSDEWKRRLWLAAKTIIDAENEKEEAEFLRNMVAGFSRLDQERRNI